MQNLISKFSITNLLNKTANKTHNENVQNETNNEPVVNENNLKDDLNDKHQVDSSEVMVMLLKSQYAFYQTYMNNLMKPYENNKAQTLDQQLDASTSVLDNDLPVVFPKRIGHPYQNRNPPKRKKPRTSFNRAQVIELEKRFVKQKYLASSERSNLAHLLKMTDGQVKTWFQNRRTKWRRQSIEQRECERQAANRLVLSLNQHNHQNQQIDEKVNNADSSQLYDESTEYQSDESCEN